MTSPMTPPIKQRGFFVLPFIPAAYQLIAWGIIALIALGVFAGLVYKVNHWHNAAWDDEHKIATKALAEIETIRKREAAIAVLYGEQVAATSAAEAKLETARNDRFQLVRSLSDSLDVATRGVPVPARSVGVFNAAVVAANASGTPGGAQETTAPAAAGTNLGKLNDWFGVVAEIHAECRDRVKQWDDFYSGLEAAHREVP